MKLNIVLISLLSYLTCSCSESTKSPARIVDPDLHYVMGLRLKEKIDSSTYFSDSLVAEKIRETEELLDIKPGVAFKLIKIDSTSYEVLVRPFSFPKYKEPFYLVTNDSIYTLSFIGVKVE